MSLGLKTAHRPCTSTPYRPAALSPIYITETSTQITPSPRSLITPSPKAFRDFGSNRDQFLSTEDSDSWSYRNPNNSLEFHQAASLTTPRKFPKHQDKALKSAPRKIGFSSSLLHKECKEGKLSLFNRERKLSSEEQSELVTARKALNEKEEIIEELQGVVAEMEEKIRAESNSAAALREENQRLTVQLRSIESDLKAKFSSEIERLTVLLSESVKKVKGLSTSVKDTHSHKHHLTQSQVIPHRGKNESPEFAMFLLTENKRLEEDMNEAKLAFQRNFASIMTSLISELAAVRHDMVQLKTLLNCIKAGELVQLDILWSTKPATEDRKSLSLAAECMKEVTTIKECTAEMRKVASSFYAEQCGQACSAQ